MHNKRNRTSSEYVGYGLYLYFLGLSTRNVVKALSFLHIVKRSHVSIWKWIQAYKPAKLSSKRKKISEFVVDETMIQVGSEFLWLWAATEPKNRSILALSISKERNVFVVAERFLSTLAQDHGKHLISTEMVALGIHHKHADS